MLDSLQPFGLPALGRLGGRARPKVPDMTPEEERSLLSSTMGVLSWLGESLDKPRLAVHGILAGKPMELLRAIPFSDTLGITDEDGILGDFALTTDKDRTSGRDLLEAWGAPRNKPVLSDWWWDLAGFATEFADPLVMVSGPGKAVTAAGKALQQGVKLAKGAEGVEQAIQHADDVVKGVAEAGKILGTSPAAKIEEIRKGQRALFNLHNPFTGRPFYEFGAGSERAAKAMETLYYGKYSPIVPLRSLLSPIVAGVDPKAGTDVLHNLAMAQKAKDRTFSDLKQLDGMLHDMGGVIDERMGPLRELWADIGKHAQESGDDVLFASSDEFVRYLSGLKDFTGKELAIPKEQIAKMFEAGGLVDAPLGKINEFVEQSHQLINLMRQVKDKSAARYIELGGKMDWLDDAFSLHSPRRPDKGVFAAMFDKIQKSRMFSTGFEWSIARKDIFRHLPGSDVTVNRACRDELLTATDDLPDALGKAMRNPEGIGSHKPAKNASQVVFDEPPVPVRAGQVAEAGGENGWVVSTTDTHATLYVPGDKPKILEVPLGQAKLATDAKVLEEVGASPWRNVERAPILTKDDLAEELRGRLTVLAGKDIPPGAGNAAVIQELTQKTIDAMSLPALQREYLWHKYLKPEVMKAAERGMNPEDVHLAVKRLREGLKKGDVFNGKVIDADEAAVLPELSEYLTKLPKDVRKTGLFNRTTFMDWMDYNEHLALSVSNLSTIHHFVRQAINTGDEKTRIPLKEAWQSVETTKGSRALTDDGLAKLARDYVSDLNKTNPTEAARILSQYDMNDPEQLGKFVETLRVNPAVSEMIGRYMDINTASGKGWLTAVYDKALTAFKWSATMPWPSFHMRNYVDGQLRNFLRVGRDTYSLPQLMRAMKESTSFWKKKNPETLRYGRDFLAEHPLRMGEAVDIQGTLGRTLDQEPPASLVDAIVTPFNLKTYYKGEAKGTWREVRNIEGLRNAERTGRQNLPAEVGKRMYEWVEFQNRYVPYAAAREAGKTHSQAMHLVNEIQYNYARQRGGAAAGNFSDNVMRRAFPWWSFTKNNIPYQLAQLINEPGGNTARLLRGINYANRDDASYTPAWLKERASVRLPWTPDDNASFVRQFGLSIEDLSQLGPNPQRAAERFIASATPAISVPYKLLSGRDPFTGRSTKELRGLTGSPLLDTLLYSSPVGRGVSTGQMLADDRTTAGLKLVNFLTGIKIGTYDVEKQRIRDLENAAKQIVEADPDTRSFTQAYVPKAKRAEADPKTLRMLAATQKLRERLKKLNEERAAKGK